MDKSRVARLLQGNKFLAAIVERYGESKTWRAGFAALQYPPSWTHTHKEAQLILSELEATTGNGQSGNSQNGNSLKPAT